MISQVESFLCPDKQETPKEGWRIQRLKRCVSTNDNKDEDNSYEWLSSQEMDTAIRVQILDKTDCISHSTNTLGKGMNSIIPPPAMGK